MRTSLFLSTLFALTFAGGAALAGGAGGAARADGSARPLEKLRAHGDVVDRTHRTVERHATSLAVHGAPTAPAPSMTPQRAPGASRVSCSDTSIDCVTKHTTSTRVRAPESSEAAHAPGHAAHAPAFLDKVLGTERTSFNEAGESTGMSSRAVRRVWSHQGNGGAGVTMPLAQQTTHARTEQQASENRTACNEGDQCMASSKKSKTQWAYQAVKAGTWKGPEAPAPSAAAQTFAAMRSTHDAPGAASTAHAAKRETTKHSHESQQ